jgi:hypothetical protein
MDEAASADLDLQPGGKFDRLDVPYVILTTASFDSKNKAKIISHSQAELDRCQGWGEA